MKYRWFRKKKGGGGGRMYISDENSYSIFPSLNYSYLLNPYDKFAQYRTASSFVYLCTVLARRDQDSCENKTY